METLKDILLVLSLVVNAGLIAFYVVPGIYKPKQ